MALSIPVGLKRRMYLECITSVLRAVFEDDELAGLLNNGFISNDVYVNSLEQRKLKAQKVNMCLSSRWRVEDSSDKLLMLASDLAAMPIPMKQFGWGNDDGVIGDLVDMVKNGLSDATDWFTSSGSLYDVRYIPVSGLPGDEEEDNVDPEKYDRYAVDLTIERDPGRFAHFIDPDGGSNGIRFLDKM